MIQEDFVEGMVLELSWRRFGKEGEDLLCEDGHRKKKRM